MSSGMTKNEAGAGESARPEHIHYDTIEKYIHESIAKKKDFLFDHRAFDEELYRLEDEYDFPYEVCISRKYSERL